MTKTDIKNMLVETEQLVETFKCFADIISNNVNNITKENSSLTDDWVAICEEVRKTIDVVQSSTTIITHLSFLSENKESCFCEHLNKSLKQVIKIEKRSHLLRGHGETIVRYMKTVVNHSNLEGDIADNLHLNKYERYAVKQIENDEIHETITSEILDGVKFTLEETKIILEENDKAKAVDFIHQYTPLFAPLDLFCTKLCDQLQNTINDLQII